MKHYRIYFALWFQETTYWWKNESDVNPLLGPVKALKQSLNNITSYFRPGPVRLYWVRAHSETKHAWCGRRHGDLLKCSLFGCLFSSFNHVANVSLISNIQSVTRLKRIPLFGFGIVLISSYFDIILLVRRVLLSTKYITSYIEKTRHNVVFKSGSSLFACQWSVL